MICNNNLKYCQQRKEKEKKKLQDKIPFLVNFLRIKTYYNSYTNIFRTYSGGDIFKFRQIHYKKNANIIH